ncbi:MAG: formylglycine-generating enzyme family protein [Armatimonadetes bacterium]|nr:formylglycine-generating enzyme family protein [Armatimonadota bacterium]
MFVRIPEGIYTLGVSSIDAAELVKRGFTFYTNDCIRQVYVRSFWIRRHPVTVKEYREFLDACGYPEDESLRKERQSAPVIGVTHTMAIRFAEWKGARLPSAFEWEAAARGTDARPLPWGYTPKPEILGLKKVPIIGTRPDLASPFGVEDLVGVVSEWTSDLVDGRAIVKGAPYNAKIAHLADESAYRPGQELFNVGFRYVIGD